MSPYDRKTYVLFLLIFGVVVAVCMLNSCSTIKQGGPCDSLPHSTQQERQDKALCEIGEHVTKLPRNR